MENMLVTSICMSQAISQLFMFLYLQTVEHSRDQFTRDRLVASSSNADAQHKRRPQLLDYHHGVHAQAVDRTRYR